jgi:A/G-specific adenine glycosylase
LVPKFTTLAIETFRRRLLAWFATAGRPFSWRSPTASLYEQIVSEVLLQRTTATAVAAFLPQFLERFPSWTVIAEASEEELGLHLRPIGLWKRRAASIKLLGEEIVRRSNDLPSTREEAQSLPGVGQYIASAILMFGHGYAEPLLDTNMARVLERYFGPRKLADIRYDPYLQSLAQAVVTGPQAREVNWAILDLGSLICRPRNPLCAQCPLADGCLTGRLNLGRESSSL